MFHRAASVSELSGDQLLAVEVDGTAMVLYRYQDRIVAVQRRCVHQGGDLANGAILSGFLVCPFHGWRFRADTGVHELAPETCLATYEVRVEGDDIMVDPTPVRHGS